MRFIQSTIEQIIAVRKQWRQLNVPYTVIRQNETATIKSKMGSYTTRNTSYSAAEISFIKAVKQYIIKNQLFEPYKHSNVKKPVYFKYGRLKIGENINNVVNIDITSAYWETAYQLGLLSDKLYEQGKEPPVYETRKGPRGEYQVLTAGTRKQVRLAAIGSLAKKIRTYEYDGQKLKALPVKHQEQTEILWDVICSKVGELLCKVARACGKDFIFFWVDGIYIKKGSEKKVCKMFKDAGYDYKINPIKSISVREKNLFVNLNEPFDVVKNGVTIQRTYKPFVYQKASKFRI